NIVAMVKKHPDGIPLKKLALYYNKTYHKNLSLSVLHFDSMASLVASLHEDLVVEQEVVFHRRDVNPREASAPIFRESYHAQLREVLGGNMRAVEAMEEDEELIGKRGNRAMDPDTVNSLMASVIRELAAEGELVTKEKIPALKDLQYIMKEINVFLESTEVVTSVCTLYELGQSLAALKDKKRYEELNLGPLCKLPLIHRMFKIDSNTKDDDIPQIETVDILKQLRIFRRKENKVKIDLAEFLKYLADHYSCDSPYELGIRIHSIALPIATLRKVTQGEHVILERARETIQKELEEETHEWLRKIKKSVLESAQVAGSFSTTGSLDLRKKYASMPASEVVLAVFTNVQEVFSPGMAKDRLATALFQLAICGGSLSVPQDLVPKDKASKATEQTKIEDKVKQYLKDSLVAQNSAITLAHIASLEKKLTRHFHVKDFLSLEQGNFLEFLVKHIQLLQDTLGSTLILGSGSMELAGSGFRPTRQDVFEFIKQCGDQLSHIESALRSHYRVRDSRDLGYGTLHMLAGLVQRQRGECGPELVGRLGEMSKDQALASLISCPLLENLSEWSQWELIFKPFHGSLKDFIERNTNTGLAALEVRPGLLLRITTNTGDKYFSSAATALDPVGTAGHLVSIVVADGITNAPTALLANHMESSLAAAMLSQAEQDVQCYNRVAKFLLECLTRIPSKTCQALLQQFQVFLEPFSRVLGQATSKEILITVARSDPRHMNCLHRLGILLGITDWVKDYQKKKSEFGIGVELTAEGQKLMQVHQERLGRSLDRLSTELYSKDTHFVLELIQNADDNSYPSEAGVVPALAFVVERDCITVLNNETGFQKENIKAICDVGRSTKGKHKYGYIQKGIGFKSVFKVTDCPEIHSNGFHLRFNKTCGPMGYILPHWTEDERPLWTTKISLPLRSENRLTRNLFNDVHPSLLLFLHRLRSITIYNQSEKRHVTMTRKDLSHSVLEVEHTEGIERWLVVKTTLKPKKQIKEDVESTELALAFQLGSDITGGDIVCQPQKQPVFAYLPLRSFGFRFIIQDFDIPSSREDVDRDSSWNQWLRAEIPQLFLQAMDVFTQDHPEFKGLKGLCQFLQFTPLPDEVLDFFKPVASQIIQLLKGKAFLPDGKVVYKLPSQVAVCRDAVIHDVIGGDELERHLSLSYLHPGLSPAPPASLLTHLGVRYLRGSDVTTVTTAMAKELGGLRQLARLLVCNFRALEHGYGEADSVLQTLRDLPIIPLADGRVVALNGEGVFFPMEETKTKKRKAQAALYKDINVVHPFLLSCLEPLESQQIRELLKRLGVHELEPQEVLEQHIYPSCQASSPWAAESVAWHQTPGEGYVLDDYPCEEFHALATAQLPGSLLLQQRMALLELLEINWDTMRETISVDILINYLKKWCVQPEKDNQEQKDPDDKSEGANFTSTVQHIHNIYTYLDTNCSQNSLKELFHHTPAVFVELNHNGDWCRGRFYHLKDVCWSDTTTMFQRYRQLTHRADSPIQEPRVLAPFYSQLEGMRDLNVDHSPNMKQYVGLLELICSSSPIPTAEVLQDVSVLYARLMVSNTRVFPTKDNCWVSLASKPMIGDSKELEKIFKPHKQVCLLNLPPAEKKAHTASGERAMVPKFNEKDRFLFLEICGIRQLSKCVKSEAQTENLRPCPSMQAMVRSAIPYIQRFLYHHDEMNEVYSELTDNNIAQKIKHLYFGQVGKLYIRHQLNVSDSEDAVIELQDVICLLKDEKELYIQKDHLTAKLDICEASRPAQEDGEQTLACWPPRASMLNAGSCRTDVAAIGEWGEQLVNSFLCHWRDSGDPGRPKSVLWCNQSGETGQPYDFKLTFAGAPEVVYVEVKATVKKEKSFIHLSANELDFALKEKERYHIFRVYSAGDAQNVRLCRIQNLAQHLHTKDLALYLFV
uniref:Wu:fj29h11 n=1 Tax=Amphiprion percula TaxID=161767 RepID=A0A3P8TIF1_AMPPE